MKRRIFLSGLTGLGLAATRLPKVQKTEVEPINTARNLIFVLLEGGPSHVDTFDLKTSASTPDLLGPVTLANGALWPAGIMPKLATMSDQFSLVRAISGVEAVHERGVYQLLTAHRQNAAFQADVPHFASMLSYLLENQRSPQDSLATAVIIGANPAKNGFLDIGHQGLQLRDDGQIQHLEHPFSGEARRFALLDNVLAVRKESQDQRKDWLRFQIQAREMMANPVLQNLSASLVDTDSLEGQFLNQCRLATKILAEKTGTRVIQLQLSGWDHHDFIYGDQEFGLPTRARAFDTGMADLIENLSQIPGQQKESLLDETLIVAMGEFGRTTGPLNSSQGRDHFPYVIPAFFAGGGIKPGRIIGKSSGDGSYIVDPGWSHARYMGIPDILATCYSAMGFDWYQTFSETPSGRTFEMVPPTPLGPAYDIAGLFS
ncbi:MAG: DUF1501 domain-containing protein [Acidobacteria bacterium]|nr:DUF1501 domain-containing protein [Acidobacteriota bacterium]MCB9398375.1 DUF1501 domain-containing protein [Acidobacteriota bacterium]